MDWSRLGAAIFDALLISFLLGGLFGPPDPFTQVVVVPTLFLVALAVTYRYEPRFYDRGWKRHALFVVFVLAARFVWSVLVRVEGLTLAFYSPVRLLALFTGVAIAGWLAYFGGVERLRGESKAQ